MAKSRVGRTLPSMEKRGSLSAGVDVATFQVIAALAGAEGFLMSDGRPSTGLMLQRIAREAAKTAAPAALAALTDQARHYSDLRGEALEAGHPDPLEAYEKHPLAVVAGQFRTLAQAMLYQQVTLRYVAAQEKIYDRMDERGLEFQRGEAAALKLRAKAWQSYWNKLVERGLETDVAYTRATTAALAVKDAVFDPGWPEASREERLKAWQRALEYNEDALFEGVVTEGVRLPHWLHLGEGMEPYVQGVTRRKHTFGRSGKKTNWGK